MSDLVRLNPEDWFSCIAAHFRVPKINVITILYDSFVSLSRESQNELDSLTHLIESMWTHYEPTISPNNLNLDQIFSFLHEERVAESKGANHTEPKGAKHDNKTLDEITDELNELNTLLSEDMVSSTTEKSEFFMFLLLFALM